MNKSDRDSMWIELRAIVEKISSSDMKVIVLSSTTDKYFTAGLDRESIPRLALSMIRNRELTR